MTQPAWWTAPCECAGCTVANTPCVRFAASPGRRGGSLHGAHAVRFIKSRERGMARIGELAQQIRDRLGLKAQRGDEPR
jgi:hypothetical protein